MKDIYTEVYSVTKKVEGIVDSTGKAIAPVRQSLLKRFPVLTILLVTFGIAATFFGIERIIEDIMWLNERPFLIFAFGVGALILSGRLYKTLG